MQLKSISFSYLHFDSVSDFKKFLRKNKCAYFYPKDSHIGFVVLPESNEINLLSFESQSWESQNLKDPFSLHRNLWPRELQN